ncbi:hypothetical protein RRG08_046000 [Elysia crispata]|uniref:Uncharacterized protein n=1 Tax=Elysia crispata TaxID=231223 RepID=A0AAE0YZW3_9GAST|nr:hypothetical protein RRG08_046000 [Elysia crispata]
MAAIRNTNLPMLFSSELMAGGCSLLLIDGLHDQTTMFLQFDGDQEPKTWSESNTL